MFLDRLMAVQMESFPESISPDDNGNMIPPVILERRLHLGFHNNHTFLEAPVIINLQPVISEKELESYLAFRGNIQIEKDFSNNPLIELVFMIEYKVQITINSPAEVKSNSLISTIIQKISPVGIDLPTIQEIDKFVCVGWGSMKPKASGTHL